MNFTTVLSIVSGYFLIGALGIFAINKKNKNSQQNQERWTKFWYYLLIVFSTILSIKYAVLGAVAALIVTIGFYEIIKVWQNSKEEKGGDFVLILSIYVLLCSFFMLFSLKTHSDVQLLVYILVIIFDGFAQIVGQLIGRKKIFPTISPNKTMEGILGGYVITIFTSLFFSDIVHPYFLLWAFLICTMALIGDLMASMFKRLCRVKDYSQLIPGHGGILDRFDSFIMSGASAYILSYWFSY